MTEIILDGMLRVPEVRLTPDQVRRIERSLTFTLPDPGRYGFGQGGPRHVQAFTRENGYIAIPRNWYLCRDLLRFNTFIDDRSNGRPIDVEFKGTYRPGQRQFVDFLVDSLKSDGLGAIGQAACGFGKTMSATAVIAALGRTALFIVHKEKLADQFIDACEKFLGFTPAKIQSDKCDYKGYPAAVAMVQSLYQRDYGEDFYRYWGLVITDECLTGDALVLTDVGEVPISEIPSSGAKSVLSFNEREEQWEPKRIVRWVPKGDKTVVEITAGGRRLRCTADHLIRTELGWVEAGKLKPGGEIYAPARVGVALGRPHSVQTVDSINASWDTSFLTVKSVVPTSSSEKVYDIEVEDNHNFVANGILVHNCHRMSAPTFSAAICKIPSKYRMGLTATPRRGDKLEDIFFYHIGDVGAVGRGSFLDCLPYIIEYHPGIRDTQWNWNGRPSLSRLVTALSRDSERTGMICRLIANAARKGRNVLALSDRVNHLDEICNRLQAGFAAAGDPYTVGVFRAGATKKIAAERARAETCHVTLGTYTMAMEGLDLPAKDTLVLATPKGDVEQATGRIRRLFEGKEAPVVLDIQDQIGFLQSFAQKRERFYRNSGLDKGAWKIKRVRIAS